MHPRLGFSKGARELALFLGHSLGDTGLNFLPLKTVCSLVFPWFGKRGGRFIVTLELRSQLASQFQQPSNTCFSYS